MKLKAKTDNLSTTPTGLVTAHLDFTSLRWQMILGFMLACLAAFTCELYKPNNFASSDLPYVAWGAGNITIAKGLMRASEALHSSLSPADLFSLLSLMSDASLWHGNFSGFLLTNFVIRALVMLFVSLVVLELTGLFGNRSGSGGAIWAAVLFAVVPNTSYSLFSIASRSTLFTALFLLASVFLWLRYRLVQERWYRLSALICLILFVWSIGSIVVQSPYHMEQSSDFFKKASPLDALAALTGLTHGHSLARTLTIAYAFSCGLFLFRLLNGWLSIKSILSVICLALPIVLTALCPNACVPLLLPYASIALSMLLPLLSLPVIDRAKQKNSLVLTALGTLSLIVIFLSWCALFADQSAPSSPITKIRVNYDGHP